MQKNYFFSLLCIFAGIFLSSCGLEEVLTVEEPTVTYNNPLYTSADPLTWYFSFKTSSDSGENFIGTDVYYKIYNSSSTLSSERSSILAVNTSTNSSAAATRMIETYSYQSLGTNISTDNSVYFPDQNSSVIFRLKTSKSADSSTANSDDRYRYHACVGTKIGTSYSYEPYIPYRNGNRKSLISSMRMMMTKIKSVMSCLPMAMRIISVPSLIRIKLSMNIMFKFLPWGLPLILRR